MDGFPAWREAEGRVMARFSGPQHKGAMRVYRQEARERAEVRQAWRERDAIREQRQPRTVWRTIDRKWRA